MSDDISWSSLASPQRLRTFSSVDSFIKSTHQPRHSPGGIDPYSRDNFVPSSASDVKDDVQNSEPKPSRLLMQSQPSLPRKSESSPGKSSAPSNWSIFESGRRRLQSATSLHSLRRRGTVPSAIPDMPEHPDYPVPNPAVTVVVIGATRCGKSAVIHHGLKNYGLSEPSSYPVPSGIVGGPSAYHTRRIGRMSYAENSDVPLHVVKISIPAASADVAMSIWPESIPQIDGVIICYDSSDQESFKPVENLLLEYHAMKTPTVVLACKSDLKCEITPDDAVDIIQRYDVGLVEVSNAQDLGVEKMRRSFDWLLRAVIRSRHMTGNDPATIYRNPASPDIIPYFPRQENTKPPIVAAPSMASPFSIVSPSQITLPQLSHTPDSSAFARLPARSRSMGDILQESGKSQHQFSYHDNIGVVSPITAPSENHSMESLRPSEEDTEVEENIEFDSRNILKKGKQGVAQSLQWATLDELLDKLLFLAVIEDDSTYTSSFLLTYRRFSCPSKLIFAMEKRIIQLENTPGDRIFASYAQMRICNLLESWIRLYRQDFVVHHTGRALSSLIEKIASKTYLLHYASKFQQLLETRSFMIDEDSAWAIADSPTESNESLGSLDSGDYNNEATAVTLQVATFKLEESSNEPAPPALLPIKSLLTLTKAFIPSPISPSDEMSLGTVNLSTKQHLKEIVRIAQIIMTQDSGELAEEITRVELELFLKIKPRNWLSYTFVSGKKDPETEPISAFNAASNQLADWVVSLIISHDRPRARAKQIEKLLEIAQNLRYLNNYSALRAFVAGINNATFVGDETLEILKAKSPKSAKLLQSWNVLFRHVRSHRAYRLALRNTMGACIPALEVHMSDLIRAHEGNADFDDSGQIHWGKFSMMGKFISHTTQCQDRCRNDPDYIFPTRDTIRERSTIPIMSSEMQKIRIASLSKSDPR